MKLKCLSGNVLKIIAAVSMLIDHIGLIFFPTLTVFRILGRLAFPIFAFMIAEGARYTKNKLKHFLTLFGLAVVCQLVYYFAEGGSLYMSVLVTFSVATLLIYALQQFKRSLFSKNTHVLLKILWGVIFAGGITATYFLNQYVKIDYGFWGCLTPVFASLLDFRKTNAPTLLKLFDNTITRVICLIPALVGLTLTVSLSVQVYCFIALIPLLLYSGKRGTHKLKYFFYIFYPLHLAILYGINMLLM